MVKTREEYSEELESQYLRLQRSHDEIIAEFESGKRSRSSEEMLDRAYSFFSMCYHLNEWIKKDVKVSLGIKNTVPKFYGDGSLVQFLICKDLANKSKHAVLETSGSFQPNDPNTKILSLGNAMFRVPIKEVEEATKKGETVHLKNEDSIFLGNFVVVFKGDNYDLKGLVQGCMYVWKTFFTNNDLLLPRTSTLAK